MGMVSKGMSLVEQIEQQVERADRMEVECATILLAGSGRTRLLQQTLTTYARELERSKKQNWLVVVVDQDKLLNPIRMMLYALVPQLYGNRIVLLRAPAEISGRIGALRNYGADVIVGVNPKYLHFIDDDVYLEGRYQRRMIAVMEKFPIVAVLGGDQHPYHQPRFIAQYAHAGLHESESRAFEDRVAAVDAVAGYSMMVRTEDWIKWLGPFDKNGKGVGASEDWALCQHSWVNGRWAAYIRPSALYHCGVTNSKGEPAVGSQLIHRREGVVYE